MKTRLDADKVEIVNTEEFKKERTDLPSFVVEKIIERFGWDIDSNNSIGYELVMAIEDIKFVDKYLNNGNDIEDRECLEYEYMNKHKCSVCEEYLLSEDEVYEDEVSGKALCDKHSIMNDVTNNYQSITDKEWEVREHCQDCTLCERVVFTPAENVIQEQWVCQRYTEDNNLQPCENVIDECKLTESLSN